jgi:hypothetical protein
MAALLVGQPPTPALGDLTVSCSVPTQTPFSTSDCSFPTTDDIPPGGGLEVDTYVPRGRNSNVRPQSLSTGDCTNPPLPSPRPPNLAVLGLVCPDGLPKGAILNVTLTGMNGYPFADISVTVTYFPSGDADTVTLSSKLPPPLTVTYPAGWNLVGAPDGTVLAGAQGPLYTFQADDSSYEILPNDTPLEAAVGY